MKTKTRLTLGLACLLMNGNILAQSGTGTIQGTLTDSTGAIMANAAVHVLNVKTGQTIDTVTNSAGFYSLPGLFAGSYTVTFSAPGMKQYERSVDLQVAQTLTVSPALTIGDSSEKITVTADSVQLATYNSGTISNQLDNARINQLPMNGRSILTLTGLTTPGLESGGTRANGLLAAGIEYVQDGAPMTNRNIGGQSAQADPDAIQEVRVETSGSNAMYATPATAVLTTKSGTNQLHGSLFETARNNAIGVARSRANPANFVAPRLIRNEFGASAGGPVLIPKLYDGRDKSFWFLAYERYSLRSGSYTNGYVPTQAMRNGDFSGLVASGAAVTLYDPNTTYAAASCPSTSGKANQYCRTPFANNQIPANRLSPLAKTLNAITPLPTNSANPFQAPNISYPATTNTDAPTISTRVDHTFNEKNNVYLRYTYYNNHTLSPYSTTQYAATVAGGGLPSGISNQIVSTTKSNSAGFGFTHIFSPTFVSQTVIGNVWQTTWANLPPNGADQNYEAQLGLPNNFGSTGMPGISGMVYGFSGTQLQWGGPEIITNIDENLTKTLGRHQLFFGGRYRHERLGILPDKTADGVTFGGLGTGLYDPTSGTNYGKVANTGSADADFYLGYASNYSSRLNPPYEHWRDQEFDAYFQDDFHVSEKMTLNLGLRWEAHPVATERINAINGFDMNNGAVVLGTPLSTLIAKGYTTQALITNLQNLGVVFETAQAAGLPPHLVYGNNAIFDPRIGFAYAPLGAGRGTVLRASFGRYSYPIPLRNFYATAKTNAPFSAVYSQSYTTGAQSPDGLNNYMLRAPQSVIAGQNSSGVVNSATVNSLTPGVTEFVLNPHYPPNMVNQLNGTVEQPLKFGSVLRVSYVFQRATNLDQQYMFNNAMSTYVWDVSTGTTPPGGTYSAVALNPYNNKTYGGLIRDDRNGYANYNALQANYQRLYKNGYAFQISYVFARSMRVGGNAFRDGLIYPAADYAPGILKDSSYDGLNRLQNYMIDTATPLHHLGFNGLVDLPFGRGKKFRGNSNRLVNELVGGFQIAYSGSVVSQYFQPTATNWGGVNPQGTGTMGSVEIYKHKRKVTDCTSGTCLAGYQWFNGYIAPLSLSNPCTANVVSGIPAGYQPYQTPVNIDPGTVTCSGGSAKASNTNYGTNNVPVALANKTTATVAYSPGPAGVNPFSKTVLLGPMNWNADISIFKVFPITEKVNFRVNMDAFNAFNIQGSINPSATSGIEYLNSSYWTPRQIQLTARLTF